MQKNKRPTFLAKRCLALIARTGAERQDTGGAVVFVRLFGGHVGDALDVRSVVRFDLFGRPIAGQQEFLAGGQDDDLGVNNVRHLSSSFFS